MTRNYTLINQYFRVLDKNVPLFNQTYNAPGLIRHDHPQKNKVKILGSADAKVCLQQEMCPKVNIKFELLESVYNEDYVKAFPDEEFNKLILYCHYQQSLSWFSSQDWKVWGGFLLLTTVTNLFGKGSVCNLIKINKHSYLNPEYNCIGYAVGIKYFISSKAYFLDGSPEQSVSTFLTQLKNIYQTKPSNVLHLLDKTDNNTEIKCFDKIQEYSPKETIEDTIIFYFSDGFASLHHAARWVVNLTDTIQINSFVSKLGHSYLVSHPIDVFTEMYGSGEICVILPSKTQKDVEDSSSKIYPKRDQASCITDRDTMQEYRLKIDDVVRSITTKAYDDSSSFEKICFSTSVFAVTKSTSYPILFESSKEASTFLTKISNFINNKDEQCAESNNLVGEIILVDEEYYCYII
jgi:hypothetical protein